MCPTSGLSSPHWGRNLVLITPPVPTPQIRRCQVPDRIVNDKVVLARPDVDEAVVLAGPAAMVWVALDSWTTPEQLCEDLAESHSEVDGDQCAEMVIRSIDFLRDEGLLERRAH